MNPYIMMLKRIRVYFVFIAVYCMLFIAGCGQATTSSPKKNGEDGKIYIVAVESFYGEVAEAVGGDSVHVQSLIRGHDIDPHDFEPTVDTAKAVHDAQVVIYNGLGYDDWVEKLIKSSGAGNKLVINVGEDIMGKREGDNEHIWYDPQTIAKLAHRLAQELSLLDSQHANVYMARANEYESSLTPLLDMIGRLKQASPKNVAVSEPVFDYMLQALNFTVTNERFAKAIAEESDPAPADIAHLQNLIKQKNIVFFVHNIQTESPVVSNVVKLAEMNQIPVIQVTETEPEDKTYIQWMVDQLQQIEDVKHLLTK